MKALIAVFLLSLSLSATAQERSFLECQVRQVHSDFYESINDFSFEDYQWLVVKPAAGGWKVSVGAMVYGEDPEDEELIQPDQIFSTWLSPTQLNFTAEHPIDHWFIEVLIARKEARFWAYENEMSAQPTKVATFDCILGGPKQPN